MLVHMYTVNSDIFARVLFSRIFADAKIRKNKPSQLPFTDVGKSCSSREILPSQICPNPRDVVRVVKYTKLESSRSRETSEY